jgi:hypothetical protein
MAVMASIDDLKAWFQRDLRFATWSENVQVNDATEKKLSIKFYTDVNEYMVNAELRDDGNVYIIGLAKSRKPRAGHAVSRVRHLLPEPAKELNPRIWRRLLGAVVGLELVRVHRRDAPDQEAEPAPEAASAQG